MCSHEDKNNGCREYGQLSRRHFMGGLGGLIAAAAVPAWVPRVVLAQDEVSGRDVIVSIFLRGGLDGLTVCPPYGDAAYLGLRPNLGLRPPDAAGENRAIDLDGFFGFAPAMQPLVEAYRDGDLLLVHACGLANAATRSHFEAMSNMETGQNKAPAELFNGWLGRHLQMTAPTLESAVLRAVGIGAGLPLTLVGGPKSLPIADLGAFGLPGFEETAAERREAMETMYRFASSAALKTTAEGTFQTVDLLAQIDFEGYQPAGGAEYPQSEFGQIGRAHV